jgi:hypothetical protein
LRAGSHVPGTFIDLTSFRAHPDYSQWRHAGGIPRFRPSWRHSDILLPFYLSAQFDSAALMWPWVLRVLDELSSYQFSAYFIANNAYLRCYRAT